MSFFFLKTIDPVVLPEQKIKQFSFQVYFRSYLQKRPKNEKHLQFLIYNLKQINYVFTKTFRPMA